MRNNSVFTIYRPNKRHEESYFAIWRTIFLNILKYRDLIWELFKRDSFAIYKKSYAGIAWLVISPIFGIVSWIFLKGTGMFNPGEVDIPYPAYVLIGSSIWGLFVGLFNASAQTLESGQAILLQVNFPHEILFVKQILVQSVNFFISILLNVFILIIFGIAPSPYAIFLPFVLIPTFLLASAIGLIVSMISILTIDINKLISAFLQILLYTTPIIYSDKINNNIIQLIIKFNPLTYLICSARDIILYGRFYNNDIETYMLCSFLSVVLFLISLRLFYISEDKIIERML